METYEKVVLGVLVALLARGVLRPKKVAVGNWRAGSAMRGQVVAVPSPPLRDWTRFIRERGWNPNEAGGPLCRWHDKPAVFVGAVREGGPSGMTVHPHCPSGADFAGIVHTHPLGVPELSDMDVQTMRQLRAGLMCVDATGPGQEPVRRCYSDFLGSR